ncbi:hypothetical protein F9B85_06420 [Heliorestis acidaminivorans]|uniref:Uncharacterized protein n=1 Tax=Heliorestis acidaminivorans TaxID=553427 RepID=A0A6I0EUD0_9FIRM|nr:hypothetical protein [Heliorestis acidaminivorans]KAB2952903.1 hypothetical protein F9B85_06420 [Heliorestis acidaminivorans]
MTQKIRILTIIVVMVLITTGCSEKKDIFNDEEDRVITTESDNRNELEDKTLPEEKTITAKDDSNTLPYDYYYDDDAMQGDSYDILMGNFNYPMPAYSDKEISAYVSARDQYIIRINGTTDVIKLYESFINSNPNHIQPYEAKAYGERAIEFLNIRRYGPSGYEWFINDYYVAMGSYHLEPRLNDLAELGQHYLNAMSNYFSNHSEGLAKNDQSLINRGLASKQEALNYLNQITDYIDMLNEEYGVKDN